MLQHLCRFIRNKDAKGYFCVFGATLIFGFTPVLAAVSYQGGNNGVNMAFLRSLLPIPVLFLLSRKAVKPALRQIKTAAILGCLLFGCMLMLYSAYTFLSVGMATTIHFLYPIYVALYDCITHKKPLGLFRTVGLILGILGMILFLDEFSALNPIGLILSFLSGFMYAAYIILLGQEAKTPLPYYCLMLIISVSGMLLCLAIGLPLGKITFQLTGKAWLFAALTALLVAVFGCVLFQRGVRTIGEPNAAMFSLLEPITSIFFSVLFLGESFSIKKVIGCIAILIGLCFAVNSSRKRESQ